MKLNMKGMTVVEAINVLLILSAVLVFLLMEPSSELRASDKGNYYPYTFKVEYYER